MKMSKEKILSGKTYLGIELGSTRIKATLIDENFSVLASGSHLWQSSFSDGYWTYSLSEIMTGLKASYKNLCENIDSTYGVKIKTVTAIGISGMMHGYLAFDENDNLLVPFRTWRNTATEAAGILSEKFRFNIPQRWSCAHLYQAVLSGEEHISRLRHMTTLSGYIHYLLTGNRVIGIGDASGMFPVKDGDYDTEKLKIYDECLRERGMSVSAKEIFPKILFAGENGGILTEEGAALLDESGELLAGIPLCPPEGDAGTGMTATNSVLPGSGNISAGTSVFSTVVLSENLKNYYPEIDVAATPDGSPCAMVHCNNCSGEIDAWVNIFAEFAALSGVSCEKGDIYEWLYRCALGAESDCGGITSFNYLSGEHLTGVEKGHPMYFRSHDSNMNLSNFFKSLICSAFATLRLGTEILVEKEQVEIKELFARGGLFKTKGVAQQILANALNCRVTVCETGGEGGSWGIAILAKYMADNCGASLADYLAERVFSNMKTETVSPDRIGVAGFNEYIRRYRAALPTEKALSEVE